MKPALLVFALLLLIIGGLIMWPFDSPRQSGPSDRDLELATLHNLNLPFFSAYFPQSDEQCDAGQRWVDEKHAWANTITDRRVRKAYLGWIDYVQTRINENRQENRTHAERRAFEERTTARDIEWGRGASLAPSLPKPP